TGGQRGAKPLPVWGDARLFRTRGPAPCLDWRSRLAGFADLECVSDPQAHSGDPDLRLDRRTPGKSFPQACPRGDAFANPRRYRARKPKQGSFEQDERSFPIAVEIAAGGEDRLDRRHYLLFRGYPAPYFRGNSQETRRRRSGRRDRDFGSFRPRADPMDFSPASQTGDGTVTHVPGNRGTWPCRGPRCRHFVPPLNGVAGRAGERLPFRV